jgi:hypothetical protein
MSNHLPKVNAVDMCELIRKAGLVEEHWNDTLRVVFTWPADEGPEPKSRISAFGIPPMPDQHLKAGRPPGLPPTFFPIVIAERAET